jgi:hypothetical protein
MDTPGSYTASFSNTFAAAGGFERDEASEAVSEEELGAGGRLDRLYVVALAVDAVAVSLWAALAAPSALDRVDGETVGELARELVEIARDCKRARDEQHAWPLPDRLVGDLRAVTGNDGVDPPTANTAHSEDFGTCPYGSGAHNPGASRFRRPSNRAWAPS